MFLRAPALHPRLLLHPPSLTGDVLCIDSVLAEGLSAELAEVVRRLPMAPTWLAEAGRAGLLWRCAVTVPERPDPQLPEPLFRVRRLLDVDLPALLERMGCGLRVRREAEIELLALRRGSWLTQAGPAALIGLTGDVWPAAWGGCFQVGDIAWSTGPDRLTLLAPGATLSVEPLQRHVEALLLVVPLEGR